MNDMTKQQQWVQKLHSAISLIESVKNEVMEQEIDDVHRWMLLTSAEKIALDIAWIDGTIRYASENGECLFQPEVIL